MDWEKAVDRLMFLIFGFALAIMANLLWESVDDDEQCCDRRLHCRVAELENKIKRLSPYDVID